MILDLLFILCAVLAPHQPFKNIAISTPRYERFTGPVVNDLSFRFSYSRSISCPTLVYDPLFDFLIARIFPDLILVTSPPLRFSCSSQNCDRFAWFFLSLPFPCTMGMMEMFVIPVFFAFASHGYSFVFVFLDVSFGRRL